MGKSLNGKELGKGLSQRKDGLYQGRFVNRFGKKQTVYAKTLNEVRQNLETNSMRMKGTQCCCVRTHSTTIYM